MKFDNNYTSIISQITKELKDVQMDNTNSDLLIKNNKDNELTKLGITERENDFVNKKGIQISKYFSKKEIKKNNKNWENVSQKKSCINAFENPRYLHNKIDTLSYSFNNYEDTDNSEMKKYISSENFIELKTFKKNIEKKENCEANKFNISNVDVDENIFSNNTYSDNYINEDEYYSDSSSEYLSSSPFKYEEVTGIKIPTPNNRNSVFHKIASPQPESKFNIGSTIASFNEIADFIYENENKRKDLDEDEFFNSGNNNSIKKNDTFIKNYLDHTRNEHSSKKKDEHHKNYDNNYITFKSLSNKKVNSNDVIDRGCLCSKIDPDDFLIENSVNKISCEKNDNNKINTDFYDYINVFELDNINNNNESLKDSQSKDYILTESHDNTTEDKEEEMVNIKKDNYYGNDRDIQNFVLNKQNIYDECIFNISS